MKCKNAAVLVIGHSGVDSRRLAFDRASVRTYDHDGRLHVAITPISKAHVCPYLGSEIPDRESLGLDAQRTYRLLRDPDELARAAPTFNRIPLIDAFDETGREHIEVSAASPKKEIVVGSTGSDAAFDTPYLRNSLVVWDAKAIRGIEDDTRREISSAYYYRADMTPGVYEGESYDGVMRDIRGNHVALVRAGRAGPDVAVGDAKPGDSKPGDSALKRTIMASTVPKLTRRGAFVHGALAAFRLAMATDARLGLNPVLAGLTRANWVAGKASILASPRPKLATEADIENLVSLLDSLDTEDAGDEDPQPGSAVIPATSDTSDADPIDEILGALHGKLSDEDLAAIEPKLRALKLAGDDDETAAVDTPPPTQGTPAPPASSAPAKERGRRERFRERRRHQLRLCTVGRTLAIARAHRVRAARADVFRRGAAVLRQHALQPGAHSRNPRGPAQSASRPPCDAEHANWSDFCSARPRKRR
ncbi:hypothetical protein BYI23_B010680 [Burkholderia sp. YI23]|nr:hypothetical protein BYI23_B010680 [Burkholderia sp. YI23]